MLETQEKFNVLVLLNKSAILKVLLSIQKTERDTLKESLWKIPFLFFLIPVEVSLKTEN